MQYEELMTARQTSLDEFFLV
ncbi:hypothetical protein AZE42_11880 [Rhizopogon vesiculosus]|uniref:Uncharacterized protein n=1 Tax=Rhizopogon vesiculosus TaxID=180088 RepID=A0A1J8PTG3_9AGAM|nr:hypothetical protein AZE42_11880 [Rhizopogon vesiculosus]